MFYSRNLEEQVHLNCERSTDLTEHLKEHVRVIRANLHVSKLTSPSHTAGIPQVYFFGQEGLYNWLVIDLLGPNLEDLFDMCGRKFTIKTVCMAARQMVSMPVDRHIGRCLAGGYLAAHFHLSDSEFSCSDHSRAGSSRKVFNVPRHQTGQLFNRRSGHKGCEHHKHHWYVPSSICIPLLWPGGCSVSCRTLPLKFIGLL
jgi:hypothetical protein